MRYVVFKLNALNIFVVSEFLGGGGQRKSISRRSEMSPYSFRGFLLRSETNSKLTSAITGHRPFFGILHSGEFAGGQSAPPTLFPPPTDPPPGAYRIQVLLLLL